MRRGLDHNDVALVIHRNHFLLFSLRRVILGEGDFPPIRAQKNRGQSHITLIGKESVMRCRTADQPDTLDVDISLSPSLTEVDTESLPIGDPILRQYESGARPASIPPTSAIEPSASVTAMP